MPLVIDRKDLSDAKYSYEKFDVKYYLDSYFQIVTGNNFTDFRDQLIFSEKICFIKKNVFFAVLQGKTAKKGSKNGRKKCPKTVAQILEITQPPLQHLGDFWK